ncbi:hypothetical protein BGW80DRAFT_241251 [Lactifluus volemus]|nr:hypothetical protein BGW80DRAFT_241251 [Lactifluus volemus]
MRHPLPFFISRTFTIAPPTTSITVPAQRLPEETKPVVIGKSFRRAGAYNSQILHTSGKRASKRLAS